jgi:hypothetical protein
MRVRHPTRPRAARVHPPRLRISITRNSIRRYDPTRYPECAARWKELFYAARHAMLRNKGQAAALDRAVRVRGRARAALRALDGHADGMLEQLLRRIEAGSPPQCGPRRAERPLRRTPSRFGGAGGWIQMRVSAASRWMASTLPNGVAKPTT